MASEDSISAHDELAMRALERAYPFFVDVQGDVFVAVLSRYVCAAVHACALESKLHRNCQQRKYRIEAYVNLETRWASFLQQCSCACMRGLSKRSMARCGRRIALLGAFNSASRRGNMHPLGRQTGDEGSACMLKLGRARCVCGARGRAKRRIEVRGTTGKL